MTPEQTHNTGKSGLREVLLLRHWKCSHCSEAGHHVINRPLHWHVRFSQAIVATQHDTECHFPPCRTTKSGCRARGHPSTWDSWRAPNAHQPVSTTRRPFSASWWLPDLSHQPRSKQQRILNCASALLKVYATLSELKQFPGSVLVASSSVARTNIQTAKNYQLQKCIA